MGFHKWNDALATGDPKKVAARYAKNAVLLPTVSDVPRTTAEGIENYFVEFLKKKPQGVVTDANILIKEGICQDAGAYEFTMGSDGSKVKARYSFNYVFEDGEWKISHHHSSAMPEGLIASAMKLKEIESSSTPTITKQDVTDLFHLWNDALATGDPKKVAARYAKNAVLLPTVSDEPRTTPEGIENYFVDFLKKKPQGIVTQANILIKDGICQDAGVYDFTMGIDGSKVTARYSFNYVFEDGEWKISHHQSSAMPEGLLAAANKLSTMEASAAPAISEQEVKDLFHLWNNALETGDPRKVAARYSKNAVLLPTVSDEPRTTPEGIENYFFDFLQKKPQGVVTKANILVSDGVCQDAGVYEFTMGVDGSKVQARYTFTYVFEDGE